MGETIFFCENCGSVVPQHADLCPACGKRFGGVRCPRCSHKGSTADFTRGCPNCHFQMSDAPPSPSRRAAPTSYGAKKPAKHKKKPAKKKSFDTKGDWLLTAAVFFTATLFMIAYYYMRGNGGTH